MKILFITSSRIGDAVLTTGVLDHLTRNKSNLQLAIAAGPVAMPLFEDWPHVWWRHTFQRNGKFGHWIDLWKQARSTKWDWVIDFRGSAFSYSVRAQQRSIWRKPSSIMHRVEAIAQVAGLAPAPKPHLYISDTRQQLADKMVQGPFLVLAPAANWAGKEWPLDRYQTLLTKLLSGPIKGWRVLVLAAPDEYERIRPLTDNLDSTVLMPIDRNRSLLDSAALMKRASFFIGNDSGLMHMAAALNIPTIGLFGPSPTVMYDPYGPACDVVRTPESYDVLMAQKKITSHACLMTGLTVDVVYKTVYEHGHKMGCFECVA